MTPFDAPVTPAPRPLRPPAGVPLPTWSPRRAPTDGLRSATEGNRAPTGATRSPTGGIRAPADAGHATTEASRATIEPGNAANGASRAATAAAIRANPPARHAPTGAIGSRTAPAPAATEPRCRAPRPAPTPPAHAAAHRGVPAPMRLTAGAAARAMAARLRPVPGAPGPPRPDALPEALEHAPITGVSIDSREIGPGALFFAIRGPNHDGHAFVPAALARGAAGAVVAAGAPLPPLPAERATPEPTGPDSDAGPTPPPFLLEVADPTTALGALARDRRIRSGATIAAITGSVGKTTAKEAAAAAIGATRPVFRTPGNRNNQWGLPLTLLAHADHPGIGVLELGMSAPGEIRALTEIALPQAGLVTAIAEAHLEHFASIEEIARAKGELYAALPTKSVALANADDPRVRAQSRRHPGRRIPYGFSAAAEIRGSDYRPRPEGGMTFTVRAFGGAPVPVRCGLEGRHNAANVLAGLALAVALEVPLAAAAEGVRELRPLPGRGDRRPLRNGAVAVDETYNSSPAALRAVIAELAAAAPDPKAPDPGETDRPARRILVAGDMRELGDRGPAFHEECGRLAAEAGLDRVVGVGPLGTLLAEAAAAAGAPDTAAAADPEAAADLLAGDLRPGDRLVFKASRAVGLERALTRLTEQSA